MIKVAKGGIETDIYEQYAASVAASNPGSTLPSSSELQAWCLNTALANLQVQRRKIRLAAVTGNIAELKRAGINLASVTDNQGRSLLHIAAMNGQMAVAKLLLSLDATLVNRQDINHMTAIDYAFQEDKQDVADFLYANGGGLSEDRLREGLVDAVQQEDVDRFKRLFRYARDGRTAVATATDKDGRSLMHICLAARAANAGALGGMAVGRTPSNPESEARGEAMLQELFACGAGDGRDVPDSVLAALAMKTALPCIPLLAKNQVWPLPHCPLPELGLWALAALPIPGLLDSMHGLGISVNKIGGLNLNLAA
mmetsp:Transcript_80256/g.215088  ORF Transcript_80256/g.215088 Transcript_80256/m.215088 type:complete len:312 (+) Transcript_80256:109-1044(+)